MHHENDGRNDHRKSNQMASERRFEKIERIALGRRHQKHKIGIKPKVEKIGRHRHAKQNQKTLRHLFDIGLKSTVQSDHNEIGRQKCKFFSSTADFFILPRIKFREGRRCGGA